MKVKPTDLHNSKEKLHRLPKELQEEHRSPQEEAHTKEVVHDDHGDVIIGNRRDNPQIKKN